MGCSTCPKALQADGNSSNNGLTILAGLGLAAILAYALTKK